MLQNIFKPAGDLDIVQKALQSLPQAVQYVLAAASTALAAFLGFALGSRSPGITQGFLRSMEQAY